MIPISDPDNLKQEMGISDSQVIRKNKVLLLKSPDLIYCCPNFSNAMKIILRKHNENQNYSR